MGYANERSFGGQRLFVTALLWHFVTFEEAFPAATQAVCRPHYFPPPFLCPWELQPPAAPWAGPVEPGGAGTQSPWGEVLGKVAFCIPPPTLQGPLASHFPGRGQGNRPLAAPLGAACFLERMISWTQVWRSTQVAPSPALSEERESKLRCERILSLPLPLSPSLSLTQRVLPPLPLDS